MGLKMNEEQMKNWIDNANYETLLIKWRSSPLGDPFFQGMMGEYYAKVMKEKREQEESNNHVKISKKIGFD